MKKPKPFEDEVRKKARELLPNELVEKIEKVLELEKSDSYLISILHSAQEHFGYISSDVLMAISELVQIPSAKVAGVASFYHFFRLKNKGRFVISVCLGTACHVQGADLVVKKIKEELGIDFGETTKDGLFTLDSARCLGACALAPVVKINETVYAHVTPDQIPAILEKYCHLKSE